MASVQIRGLDGDTIALRGDIHEEYEASLDGYDDCLYLSFSDGTILRAWSDFDDCWRFFRVAPGTSEYAKEEPDHPRSGGSDVVTLRGDNLDYCGVLHQWEAIR